MDKLNAVITGVGGYVPEDVLTNGDISKLVDTTDEWIMTRVGIKKERRILKGEGVGTSYMGIRAVKQLLEKNQVNPDRDRSDPVGYYSDRPSLSNNVFNHRLPYRL